MGAWGLGLAIFLDDYLSALTVGLSMRKITDAFKVPRPMLAYIVNTTAAPWCVIVPISTWTIFVGKLLETSHVAPKGAGLATYWKMIPFISYGYISVLIIPFFIYGLLPWFGRMKKADQHATETGQLTRTEFNMSGTLDISPMNVQHPPKLIYFLLPVIILLAATIFFDIDALKGVMIAVTFTFLYYLVIRLGTFRQLSETIFSGFNSMVYALAILVMSYVLKDVNYKMGLCYLNSPSQKQNSLRYLRFAARAGAVVTGCSVGGFKAREQDAGGRTHAHVDEITPAGVIISDGRSGARFLKAPIADRTIGNEQFSITAMSRRGQAVGDRDPRRGAHVLGRQPGIGAARRVEVARDAPVDQRRLAALAEQDVVRRAVAVHHVALVGIRQRLGDRDQVRQ